MELKKYVFFATNESYKSSVIRITDAFGRSQPLIGISPQINFRDVRAEVAQFLADHGQRFPV